MSAEANKTELDDIQKQIFERIAKNDLDGFRQLTAQLNSGVDFVDENGGMTPLQHACCKGNKEAVQILLDMGADVNYNKHGADYTPLHFAALSGNTQVCRLLLDAGGLNISTRIKPNSLNSVSRTAAQMAAFVGNHACVETINNYIPRSQLEYYTKPTGLQTEPLISPASLDSFHEFVIEVNLHPVRIALNIQTLGLVKEMAGLRRALNLMCEKEMKKSSEVNELMAFKFHYLSWTVAEIMRCEEQSSKAPRQQQQKPDESSSSAGKHDFIEVFIKRVLKENKQGQLDYMEYALRDCIREFPFRECTVFRQIVAQLGSKDAPPALTVLRNAINGHRGFADEIVFCSTCGNEKPDKKCSKCKVVKYCDRECQRLHWFMHKKSCARLTSANALASPTGGSGSSSTAGLIDTEELREELSKMKTAAAH